MHPKFGSHPHLYPDLGILLNEFLPLWNRGNSINFDDNSISWSLMKSFWEVGRLNQQTIQLWNQIWNAKVSTQNCRLYIQQTSLFFLLTVVADYLLGRLRHLKNNFKKTRQISYKFKDNQRTTSTVDINAEPDHNSDPGISNGISNAPGYGQFFWSFTGSAALAEDCALSSSLLLLVY